MRAWERSGPTQNARPGGCAALLRHGVPSRSGARRPGRGRDRAGRTPAGASTRIPQASGPPQTQRLLGARGASRGPRAAFPFVPQAAKLQEQERKDASLRLQQLEERRRRQEAELRRVEEEKERALGLQRKERELRERLLSILLSKKADDPRRARRARALPRAAAAARAGHPADRVGRLRGRRRPAPAGGPAAPRHAEGHPAAPGERRHAQERDREHPRGGPVQGRPRFSPGRRGGRLPGQEVPRRPRLHSRQQPAAQGPARCLGPEHAQKGHPFRARQV